MKQIFSERVVRNRTVVLELVCELISGDIYREEKKGEKKRDK